MKVLLHLDDKKIIKKNMVVEICPKKFQIMVFLYNSLQEDWTIGKNNNSYILKKKHEGKKEIFEEGFLNSFIDSQLNLEKILLQ